ncbi:MAG: 3D domain-containing protein, partial [Candidatus Methanomethyliaceae archaeon]
ATAYTAGPESTGKKPGDPGYGITASGFAVGPGVVAADPRFPFGTRLWIEGYGFGIVLDRGEAIRGNRLDLYFQKLEDALAWGVRQVEVIVLGDFTGGEESGFENPDNRRSFNAN